MGSGSKCKSNPEDKVLVKSSLFVKVNMDGVAIGRKVDLNAHPSYESLARTLEDMFTNKAVESELFTSCCPALFYLVVFYYCGKYVFQFLIVLICISFYD